MVGTGNDPNKRIGMFWDKKMNICRHPVGTTVAEYPFPSAEKQQADELSILAYYQDAMQLRLAHPEIARGTSTVLESPDDNVAMVVREYAGQRLLMILNMNIDDYTLTVPDGFTAISGELEVWGHATLENGRLAIPAYGIVLMR